MQRWQGSPILRGRKSDDCPQSEGSSAAAWVPCPATDQECHCDGQAAWEEKVGTRVDTQSRRVITCLGFAQQVPPQTGYRKHEGFIQVRQLYKKRHEA